MLELASTKAVMLLSQLQDRDATPAQLRRDKAKAQPKRSAAPLGAHEAAAAASNSDESTMRSPTSTPSVPIRPSAALLPPQPAVLESASNDFQTPLCIHGSPMQRSRSGAISMRV
jgi:hypothetical protein